MVIKAKAAISISEAIQDFSCVTHLVDEKGTVTILENNVPKYVLMKCSEAETERYASDEEVMAISDQLMNQHLAAYMELAK